nr:ABC-2 family transporter protein [Actinoplanes ferrugineus]
MLGLALPFAFISFFPIAYLLDTGPSRRLGLLTPLVAVYCAGTAIWIFQRGLRRYESAGN